ncbi:phage tail protein [Pseudomonas aeruginosa]
MYYYHAKTGGFYRVEIHGEGMPPFDELAAVADERYAELFDAQGRGLQIMPDDTGQPQAVEPPPPSADVLSANERLWRDRQLDASDGLVSRHRDEQDFGEATTLTPEQFRELGQYRAGLRAWPESPMFPDPSARPSAPAWLL